MASWFLFPRRVSLSHFHMGFPITPIDIESTQVSLTPHAVYSRAEFSLARRVERQLTEPSG